MGRKRTAYFTKKNIFLKFKNKGENGKNEMLNRFPFQETNVVVFNIVSILCVIFKSFSWSSINDGISLFSMDSIFQSLIFG